MKSIYSKIALLSLCAAPIAHAAQTLEISFENLASSGGLYATPVWFGLHNGSFDTFTGGQAASLGLETLAETGNTATLDGEFGNSNGRQSNTLANGGPFGPGASNSFQITADETLNRYLNYATMIIPSNDAFIGNGNPTGIELFNGAGVFNDGNGAITLTILGSMIYDAGTEVNDATLTGGAAFLQGVNALDGTPEGGVVSLLGSGGLDDFTTNGILLANGNSLTTAFTGTTQIAQITITAVPEPSTYAGVAGIAALVLVTYCKRRKRS